MRRSAPWTEIDMGTGGSPSAPGYLHNGGRDVATLPARTGWPPVIRALSRRRATPVDPSDTPAAPLDDAALVERSRTDAEAFGELYDRYCAQIHRYVARRVGDREAAQDVTAEVFLKALRAIDSYRPATAPFAAWLHRIAANAVIDHLRARKVTTSLDA